MNLFKASEVMLTAFALVFISSCSRHANPQVEIEVSFESTGRFVLNIRNETDHLVLFDDPRRIQSTTRLDWELALGATVVERSDNDLERKDPLIAGHTSTGPLDLGPGRPFRCDLGKYYPRLLDQKLIQTADTFLWYMRTWDATSATWIQTNGIIRLR